MIDATGLVAAATDWVSSQRVLLRSRAQPLDTAEHAVLDAYFDQGLLDTARVIMLDDLCAIDDSAFRSHFGAGALPIDLKAITGLTLIDTICISRKRLNPANRWLGVLFQEMVHVCQFHRLGIVGFLTQYLHGWLAAGKEHSNIPLERHAAALRERFERYPRRRFSVLKELTRAH